MRYCGRMPPFIAVSMSSIPGSGTRPERATLNAAYLRALEAAGGVPLLVAPQASRATVEAIVAAASGLILTGGADIDPARYGQQPHPTVSGTSPERDATEALLVRLAFERGLPVLAICRGMQLLNVALGGTLVQDIPSQVPNALAHAQEAPRGTATHDVRVEPSSALAKVLGCERARVNSMHHQAVDQLGEGLVPVAWAPDGVVEGLELPGRPVLGVQWHPEDLHATEPHAAALFRWLCGVAR